MERLIFIYFIKSKHKCCHHFYFRHLDIPKVQTFFKLTHLVISDSVYIFRPIYILKVKYNMLLFIHLYLSFMNICMLIIPNKLKLNQIMTAPDVGSGFIILALKNCLFISLFPISRSPFFKAEALDALGCCIMETQFLLIGFRCTLNKSNNWWSAYKHIVNYFLFHYFS